MKAQKIKKILKFLIIILMIVFVYNTGFYALLKSSKFTNIVGSYIQDDNSISKVLGDIHSINYRYIGRKSYSWTDGYTRVAFDVVVHATNSNCILHVVVEKRKDINNAWSVSSVEKKD